MSDDRQLLMDVAVHRYVSPSCERLRRAAAKKLGLTLGRYDDLVRARKKHCCGCGRWLVADVATFGVCRKQWDGLNGICRDCRRDYDRVRRALSQGETLNDQVRRSPAPKG